MLAFFLKDYLSIRSSVPFANNILIFHICCFKNIYERKRTSWYTILRSGKLTGEVAKVLDWDIVVCEFELRLRNYVHFWTNTFQKGINSFIHPARGQTVPLLSFSADSFGIK